MKPALHASGALLVLLAACGGGSDDPGLGAWLRIAGARFQRGALPAPGSGPAVLTFDVSRNGAARGDTALHLSGTLAPAANAVALALDGDEGFWLLPAGLPDVTVPGEPTFAVTAGVSRHAPLGTRALVAQAFSAAGVAGPRATSPLEITGPATPNGSLVVSLTWDTDSDLDLHVVDANGVEIWARAPSSWKPAAGAPPDPTAWKQGGLLDVDSNARCVIDGREAENVIWSVEPPTGHYVVRVDAPSLCGQTAARWRVEARLHGQRVAAAGGLATDASTRPPHDLGAGVLALQFDVP